MWSRCILCALILVLSFLWTSTKSAELQNSNSSAFMMNVGKFLTVPLKDIPHLNLLLRARDLQHDADNVYTRWLLNDSLCPLSISTYVELDSGQLNRYRENYAVVVDMLSLRLISKRSMQKASTFFFILADDDHVDRRELFDILHSMWHKYSVFKNYILSTEGVLIYDPFEYDPERNEYGQIKYYFGNSALIDLLFSDMRGYPLRVQIFGSVYARPEVDKATGKILKIGGVDGKVAKMLQERMNFAMSLEVPSPHKFGERSKNGTYNGAIGSIINNEIDICLTGFFVKDYMAPEMSFTVTAYDDQLCIYVPKAESIPQSILPLFSVGFDLWLSFILAGFLSATIWSVMRCINLKLEFQDISNLKLDTRLNHQIMRIFIDTWEVWVRVNINRYPPFYSERIFVASLCLVSVIFGAIFESSLSTVYIHPMYFRDINTLQELDESGLRIIYKFAAMADDLFFSETSPLFASLDKKLTFLNDLNADITLDIAENRGKASVTRKSSILLESLDLILSKKIWMVPECPKYYTISYAIPKDSPIENPVNRLILRASGAGLIKKWISDMHTDVDIEIMNEHRLETTDILKVLQITDLQLAFYVIVFGSFLGGVSLLVEIYVGRMARC